MAPVTRRGNGRVFRPSSRQPIPRDVMVELTPKHGKTCMFCGRKEISEKLYGPLYQLNGVVVHYFCILLSSRAVQNGTDRQGIWGFLLEDIETELDRGSKETCTYCKTTGATISCCSPRCQKIFHLPCGLKQGSMHQFFQTFKSFCHNHRLTQNVDIKDLQQSTPIQCSICQENVIPKPSPSSIWAPCCRRNAWFHRECIQDHALSTGYFFKCPLCNNVDIFKSVMLTLGIYIPSRDASWEVVPNAYSELLERHNACNADTCLCPSSDRRSYYQETGSWEIILCHACGSHGTHRLCSNLKHNQEWYCSSCSNVVAAKENPARAKKRRLEVTGNQNNCISTTTQSEITNQISQTNNVTQSNLRESSMNLTTRERTRQTRNRSRYNMIVPQQVSEIISLISDEEDHTTEAEDSNDSDVQASTSVLNINNINQIQQNYAGDMLTLDEIPKTESKWLYIHQIVPYVKPSNSTPLQVPMSGSSISTSNSNSSTSIGNNLMLGSSTSMSSSNSSTSNGNNFHLNRIPPSSSQARNSNHHLFDIIDLTLDDN